MWERGRGVRKRKGEGGRRRGGRVPQKAGRLAGAALFHGGWRGQVWAEETVGGREGDTGPAE